ncbi:MAG: glycosyltransferase family 2 protein [Deltaproteobacteria bacterium]|nr:glycosyltransferase family 2 protein [Deltaproteobacteria bacterium]
MRASLPKVTVLMPVYNGEKYLREAIESIRGQTFTDFEFLIINDGSTDESANIIASYNDSRIRLVHNNKNLKLVATLNRGIDLAEGEYIARMDCDDISLPERLSKQVRFMDTHREVGICGTWVRFFGEENDRLWCPPTDANEIKCTSFFTNALAHPSVMMRKSQMKEHNLYYDPKYIHILEDFELWHRCSFFFPLSNVPEILLNYRVSSTSFSHSVNEVRALNLGNIYRNNMRLIGIEASEEEVSLLISIFWGGKVQGKDFAIRVEKILLKLNEMNKVKKIYPEDIFFGTISKTWSSICLNSSEPGLKEIKTFWNSPLRRLDMSLAKQLIKRIVKKYAQY